MGEHLKKVKRAIMEVPQNELESYQELVERIYELILRKSGWKRWSMVGGRMVFAPKKDGVPMLLHLAF